jgi:hypothetical protein
MTTVHVVTYYDDAELTTDVVGVYTTRQAADKAIEARVAAGDAAGEYDIHEMPLEE